MCVCVGWALVFQLGAPDCVTPCVADETACHSALAWLPFEGQARGRRGAANGL